MLNNIEQQLQKTERLAYASKLIRFANDPVRYVKAMLLLHLFYPVTKRGSLTKANTFFGDEMKVLLPAATDIYLTGGKTHRSEIALVKFLISALKRGQAFLDVGAHFGYFSLLAANLVGKDGSVIGVEPAKGSFEVLSQNTYNKKHVKVLHNAVSDKNEVVSFYEFPIIYSEYNALDVSKFETEAWMKKYAPEKTEVPAITLDELCREQNIKPDVIKIDVEGAEVHAIKGGTDLWSKASPIVIMEYLASEDERGIYDNATRLLKDAGYKSFMIRKDGSLEETDDILRYMSENELTSENIVFKKGNK